MTGLYFTGVFSFAMRRSGVRISLAPPVKQRDRRPLAPVLLCAAGRTQGGCYTQPMTPLLIGALIGLALFFGYGFILALMAMLGIPLSSRRGNEKRAAIAAAMQADMVEREAARQVAIRAAIERLER